jgi:hypothetical protein
MQSLDRFTPLRVTKQIDPNVSPSHEAWPGLWKRRTRDPDSLVRNVAPTASLASLTP